MTTCDEEVAIGWLLRVWLQDGSTLADTADSCSIVAKKVVSASGPWGCLDDGLKKFYTSSSNGQNHLHAGKSGKMHIHVELGYASVDYSEVW